MEPEEDQMLYVTFNQDCSCIAVGTERGYRIYNALPFSDFYERIMDGGIGLIEMLYKSNILALVGGGKYPKYPQNKVILWDDHNGKVFTELTFTSYVNNVKIKKEHIIIVCDNKIYILNLSNLQQIDIINSDFVENKKGLIAITYDFKVNIIAYPDKAIGYVRVKFYDTNQRILINAHDSPLACLVFNNNGKLLATASKEGRYMRIFRTDTGIFIYEFQISSSIIDVYSINFDAETNFVCCSIANGLIQIFSLKKALEKESFEPADDSLNHVGNNIITTATTNHSLKDPNLNSNNDPVHTDANKDDNIPIALPTQSLWNKFFSRSEAPWSVCHLPENKSIAYFVPTMNNKIIAIGAEGRYYLAKFNLEVSEMAFKEEEKSLKINLYD